MSSKSKGYPFSSFFAGIFVACIAVVVIYLSNSMLSIMQNEIIRSFSNTIIASLIPIFSIYSMFKDIETYTKDKRFSDPLFAIGYMLVIISSSEVIGFGPGLITLTYVFISILVNSDRISL